ncbi:hypothetical protein OAA77_00695 [Gammaproteobacteria bacterium]|nr:hypothetical protein [Gammaproteobacteria bacterium]
MLNDGLKLTGKLKIALNGETVQEIDNLVVTDGKEYVASRMKDATATAMSHMAIGSGSTAAAAGDSSLGTELGRVALTSTNVSGAIVTYTATFAAGTGTGAVTEAGILNASSSGDLLCRTVFSVVNKGASDSMTITWTVTVS